MAQADSCREGVSPETVGDEHTEGDFTEARWIDARRWKEQKSTAQALGSFHVYKEKTVLETLERDERAQPHDSCSCPIGIRTPLKGLHKDVSGRPWD